MSKSFAYTGCDNLEVMTVAKKYNRFLVELVTDTTDNLKQKKVLDFGAGSGTYSDLLKERGVAVDCLEPDATLGKVLAKKNYKVHDSSAKLKPNTYDVIYSFNVFEHIEDDFEAARQVSKALKPGGVLIIYVPAFQTLYSSMDKKVEHVRRYKMDRLQKISIENKLSVSTLRYCDPVGFFAALFYKHLGSKDGSLSVGAIKFYDSFIFPISRVLEFFTKRIFGKNALLVAIKK